jgi:hypothetical protein
MGVAARRQTLLELIFNQIFVAWGTSFATFLGLRCGNSFWNVMAGGSDNPESPVVLT